MTPPVMEEDFGDFTVAVYLHNRFTLLVKLDNLRAVDVFEEMLARDVQVRAYAIYEEESKRGEHFPPQPQSRLIGAMNYTELKAKRERGGVWWTR